MPRGRAVLPRLLYEAQGGRTGREASWPAPLVNEAAAAAAWRRRWFQLEVEVEEGEDLEEGV